MFTISEDIVISSWDILYDVDHCRILIYVHNAYFELHFIRKPCRRILSTLLRNDIVHGEKPFRGFQSITSDTFNTIGRQVQMSYKCRVKIMRIVQKRSRIGNTLSIDLRCVRERLV